MERREIDGWNVRWDVERAGSAYRDGWWGDSTIAADLAAIASEDPDRILIVDGEIRVRACELEDWSASLAGWLMQRTRPGEVVSFMLPNWHEAAVVYLAATKAGLVANPILPSLRDRELGFILADCASRVVFVPTDFAAHDYAAMLRRVANDLASPPEIVTVRGVAQGATELGSLLAGPPAESVPQVLPDAVRMVMYTSGTTGQPKGVLHTHNSLHALIMQLRDHWHIAPGDRFLVPSPTSHIGGSIYAFEMPILLGTRAVLMDKWDADRAIELMLAERITHMAGATPFLERLLASALKADTHLPDLKVFICGGASVPPVLVEEAADWFDRAIVTRAYGSTEVPVTAVGALDRPAMPEAAHADGAIGIADARIAANGEILVRGPQMLAGYLRQADEDDAFDSEGYFRTGDQGHFDEHGYLVVTGRIKDLIIRNGENIAPKEIEDLLTSHPAISEIAIVGLPDQRTGERACAVIVPQDGESPDVASIAQFLESTGVARFKLPERVELRTSLPRNDAGKVLKHVLRAEYAP